MLSTNLRYTTSNHLVEEIKSNKNSDTRDLFQKGKGLESTK